MLARPLFFTSCKYLNQCFWCCHFLIITDRLCECQLCYVWASKSLLHIFASNLVPWMRSSTPPLRSEATWRRSLWTTRTFSCGTSVARSPWGRRGIHITQTQRSFHFPRLSWSTCKYRVHSVCCQKAKKKIVCRSDIPLYYLPLVCHCGGGQHRPRTDLCDQRGALSNASTWSEYQFKKRRKTKNTL